MNNISENKKYIYFISYQCEFGYGNANYILAKKIDSMENIIEIQKEIGEKTKATKVCINNFILLKEIT